MLSRDRQNNERRIFKCFRFIGRIVKGYSNATTKKEKNYMKKNDVTTSDIKIPFMILLKGLYSGA